VTWPAAEARSWDQRDVIGRKAGVGRHDREPLTQGLRYQQSIERVAMMEGQVSHAKPVLGSQP